LLATEWSACPSRCVILREKVDAITGNRSLPLPTQKSDASEQTQHRDCGFWNAHAAARRLPDGVLRQNLIVNLNPVDDAIHLVDIIPAEA